MRNRKRNLIYLSYYLALLVAFISVSGCTSMQEVGVPQWIGSGFLRKEFPEYKGVAVLPFENDSTGEVSDTFARSFHEKFPQMAIVGRKQVLERFQEPSLYYGRLDKETRTEIGRVFHVQAVIMGNVIYPSVVRWLLQVILVDTETDTVLGRSYVEINFFGAEGMKQGCDLAVQQLVLR